MDLNTLRELGFKIVIFPISALLSATKAIMNVLGRIKKDGTPINVMGELFPFNEFLNFIGLPEVQQLEKKYVSKER